MPPFWRSLNHHISVKNRPIWIKFGTLKQILHPMTVTWPKIEIFKIQDGRRPPFSKIVKLPYLSEKLCDFDEIRHTTSANGEQTAVSWPKIEIFEIQDGGGRHLKKRFLAITHQPIVRFQRNFVWGSRTACRDGRHVENGWMDISQWKIVRFWWKLVHYIGYWTCWQSVDQKLKFLKFKMVAAAILKIVFLAITHQPIDRFQRNFVWASSTAWW